MTLNNEQRMIYGLLKYSDWPGEALQAVEKYGGRNLDKNTLRALGLFTVGHDSYFIRYSQQELDNNIEGGIMKVLNEPGVDRWELTFSFPGDSALDKAYRGLAGLVLTYLYHEASVIPVAFRENKAVLLGDMPGSRKELWQNFLDWMKREHNEIIVNNLKQIFDSKGRVGGLLFPLELVSYFGKELRTAVKQADKFYNDRFIYDRETGEVLMDKIFERLGSPAIWEDISNMRKDLKDILQNYLENEGHKDTSGNLWNAVSTLVMVRILLTARENDWPRDADIVKKFFHEVAREDLAGKYNKTETVLSLYDKLYDILSSINRKDIYTLSLFKLENLPALESGVPFEFAGEELDRTETGDETEGRSECSICGRHEDIIEEGTKFLHFPGEGDICSLCYLVSVLSPSSTISLDYYLFSDDEAGDFSGVPVTV
ncbi:MAG: hypothetical protein ACOC5A_03255 [Halanaerobiales bacterium]